MQSSLNTKNMKQECLKFPTRKIQFRMVNYYLKNVDATDGNWDVNRNAILARTILGLKSS